MNPWWGIGLQDGNTRILVDCHHSSCVCPVCCHNHSLLPSPTPSTQSPVTSPPLNGVNGCVCSQRSPLRWQTCGWLVIGERRREDDVTRHIAQVKLILHLLCTGNRAGILGRGHWHLWHVTNTLPILIVYCWLGMRACKNVKGVNWWTGAILIYFCDRRAVM